MATAVGRGDVGPVSAQRSTVSANPGSNVTARFASRKRLKYNQLNFNKPPLWQLLAAGGEPPRPDAAARPAQS